MVALLKILDFQNVTAASHVFGTAVALLGAQESQIFYHFFGGAT